MCVFNGFFMRLGPDFSPFGHDLLLEKIFLVMRETECWTKLFSDSHNFFFFFSTACFFDIISPMSPQVLESTFSTDHWWSFKELCFQKDIHLVFSITCRTSVKDAGFIYVLASVGIRWDLWLHRNGARAYASLRRLLKVEWTLVELKSLGLNWNRLDLYICNRMHCNNTGSWCSYM